MKSQEIRKRLLGSAGLCLSGLILASISGGSANAQSVCSAEPESSPQEFNCVDSTTDPVTIATGTVSDGSTFSSSSQTPLQISNSGALDVVLVGQVNGTTNTTSVVHVTSGGPLSFQSSGTTSSETTVRQFNTYLRSDSSITANTMNVYAAGPSVTGVVSEAMNGDNTLSSVQTTVVGSWSRGLWTDAFNGHNVTNTGTVYATGEYARGVIARALPSQGYCTEALADVSVTVNVTGDISADYVPITTLTCGRATVNIQTDTTVAHTGSYGFGIVNIAVLSADTNIDGSLLASSLSGNALDVRDGPSTTRIGGTGNMFGTFDGDEDVDSFAIAAGGTWSSSGVSDFRGGIDDLTNSGTINVSAGTFANLETFTNDGVLAITGGAFDLSGSTTFTNNGTIQVAPGETTITSTSALTNNATIDLQNGQAGDILTIANDYIAGSGAQLMIDMFGEVSDMFVVNGTSTGTTQIFVNAPASMMSSTLIGVLDPEASGTTAGQGLNFTLGNRSASRLIDLRLNLVGNNLYLSAVPNEIAYQPLVLGTVARDLWRRSADALQVQFGASTRGPKGRPFAVWGHFFAGENRFVSSAIDQTNEHTEHDRRVRPDPGGGQFGIDFAFASGSINAGVSSGYQLTNADSRSFASGVTARTTNFSAYAAFGGTTGFYGNLLLKHDWHAMQLTNDAFSLATNDPNAQSIGASGKAGFRWISNPLKFDMGGGLSYVQTRFDDFSAEGIEYSLGDDRSVLGELRGRVTGSSKLAPFADISLFHEFAGDSQVKLRSGSVMNVARAGGQETWARLKVGFAGTEASVPTLAGWVELGDRKGLGLTGALRF